MTDPDLYLESLYRWAFSSARDIVGRGEDMTSVLLCCRIAAGEIVHDEGVEVVLVGNLEPEHKPALMAFVREQLASEDVNACCLIVETWVSSSENVVSGEIRPVDDPDRHEAVVFLFYTSDYEAMAVCPIDRRDNTLEQGPIRLDNFVCHTMSAARRPDGATVN